MAYRGGAHPDFRHWWFCEVEGEVTGCCEEFGEYTDLGLGGDSEVGVATSVDVCDNGVYEAIGKFDIEAVMFSCL